MVQAVDMEKTARPVYILGSLVHNPDVVKKIKEKGVQEISREGFLRAKAGEIGTLVITAHGVGPEIFRLAKEKNIKIINTTCPRVIKVQKLAEVFAKRGYEIILVGDKGHSEVNGIFEWGGKKARIISNEKDLEEMKIDAKKKIAVLSQTTQDEKFFQKVSGRIKSQVPQAEIVDTICHATHDRQEEVRKLAEKYDLVLVIGSASSANSTRLFEIARAINPKTYFVENISGIKPEWFSGIKSAAITAGASTPSWIIAEVLEYVEKLG